MPLKTSATGETIGMRYVSARLGKAGPLAKFIAKRRTPGDGWLAWEKIAAELMTLTRESVTRAGITKWAEAYGIPDSKRDATDDERAEYLAAVDKYLHPSGRGGRAG